jgi:hypothetical protein
MMNSDPPGVAAGERWWRQRPRLGVAVSLATGVAALWLAQALAAPSPEARIAYLVSLPIALLLPALAVAAGLMGWQAWRASHSSPLLAVPALAAMGANLIAVWLFVRIAAGLLAG